MSSKQENTKETGTINIKFMHELQNGIILTFRSCHEADDGSPVTITAEKRHKNFFALWNNQNQVAQEPRLTPVISVFGCTTSITAATIAAVAIRWWVCSATMSEFDLKISRQRKLCTRCKINSRRQQQKLKLIAAAANRQAAKTRSQEYLPAIYAHQSHTHYDHARHLQHLFHLQTVNIWLQ